MNVEIVIRDEEKHGFMGKPSPLLTSLTISFCGNVEWSVVLVGQVLIDN